MSAEMNMLRGGRRTWRDRFDHAPGEARPNRIRTGAIFVALTLIFLWIIYTKPTLPPSARRREMTADFGRTAPTSARATRRCAFRASRSARSRRSSARPSGPRRASSR